MPVVYFFLVRQAVQTPRDKKIALVALMWSGIWLSVWGLLEWTYDGRAKAFYESANYLALYLGPIAVLFGTAFLGNGKKKYLIPGLLVFVALLMTKSYAAILAVLGGLFVYMLLSKKIDRRHKVVATACALLVAAIFTATQIHTEKFQEFFEFEERASTSARLQIWHASYEMIKDVPILGIGLGQYELNYQWEMTDLYDLDTYEWLVPHPHNFFMAIWLNFGLLGLVSMLGIIVLAIYRGRHKPVILAMLVAVLIHGLFDTPFMKNDLAMQFWLIIALLI